MFISQKIGYIFERCLSNEELIEVLSCKKEKGVSKSLGFKVNGKERLGGY